MNVTRKEMSLRTKSSEEEGETQPWRVTTADGRVRGPVGINGLKSLLQVGILNRAATISSVDQENWSLIAEHPVWQQLQPSSNPLKLRNSELMEGPTETALRSPTSPVSEERALKMEALRRKEVESIHRRLSWWKLGKALRAVREVLIFLGFLTAGDFAVSFLDTSAGLVKWALLLCLTCTAVMYYSIRAMDR